jgi:hypothetical protein
MGADADRDRFFPGVEMDKARNLAFAELDFDAVLKGPYELHTLIHPQQFILTDVHAWSLLTLDS